MREAGNFVQPKELADRVGVTVAEAEACFENGETPMSCERDAVIGSILELIEEKYRFAPLFAPL
jgi:hypothetical protein